MLECVINVSEGRRADVLDALAAGGRRRRCSTCTPTPTTTAACSRWSARTRPRAVAAPRSPRIDLAQHTRGPPADRGGRRRAVRALATADDRPTPSAARDRFAPWAADELGAAVLPLRAGALAARRAPRARSRDWRPTPGRRAAPDGRRHARSAPDRCWWPTTCGWPSPTSSAARRIAATLRGPAVRALGLAVGDAGAGVDEPRRTRLTVGPGGGLRRGGGAWHRRTAPSWSGWSRVAVLDAIDRRPVGRARPGRRPHDRGPPRTAGRRLSDAGRTAQAVAPPAARRASARWRRMRRRSRSLMPPQMPNFSPLASAYSRQSSRTTQPRHTSFASRVDAPARGRTDRDRRPGSWRGPASPSARCRLLAWCRTCRPPPPLVPDRQLGPTLDRQRSVRRLARVGWPPFRAAHTTGVITTV